MRGGHLGHVAWTIYIIIVSFSLPKEAPHVFGIDWLSAFREEDV